MAGRTVRPGMAHAGPNTKRYSTRDDDIGRQLVTIFLVVADQADKSQQLWGSQSNEGRRHISSISLHASWVVQGRFLPLRCLRTPLPPSLSTCLRPGTVKRKSVHRERGVNCFGLYTPLH